MCADNKQDNYDVAVQENVFGLMYNQVCDAMSDYE
jgi:hypothetical protein